MIAPLAKPLTITLSLKRVADASGVSLLQARRFLLELATLPADEGDEILAEARRERLREVSAQIRRGRRAR